MESQSQRATEALVLKFMNAVEQECFNQESSPSLTSWDQIKPLRRQLVDFIKNKLVVKHRKNMQIMSESLVKYIEIVLSYVHGNLTDEKRQRKYLSMCLDVIPELVSEGAFKNIFVQVATPKILEMFIMDDLITICKGFLIRVFNQTIVDADKAVRCRIAEELPDEMYKLFDQITNYGDFVIQSDIMEAVFRIYGHSLRSGKIKYHLVPGSEELSNALQHISCENFDSDIRMWLNRFNQNSAKIFSISCVEMKLGDEILEAPQTANAMWIDFNLEDKSMGWYCDPQKNDDWIYVFLPSSHVQTASLDRKRSNLLLTILYKDHCIAYDPFVQDYFNVADRRISIKFENVTADVVEKFTGHVLPSVFPKQFMEREPSSRISSARKLVYDPLPVQTSRKSMTASSDITSVSVASSILKENTSTVAVSSFPDLPHAQKIATCLRAPSRVSVAGISVLISDVRSPTSVICISDDEPDHFPHVGAQISIRTDEEDVNPTLQDNIVTSSIHQADELDNSLEFSRSLNMCSSSSPVRVSRMMSSSDVFECSQSNSQSSHYLLSPEIAVNGMRYAADSRERPQIDSNVEKNKSSLLRVAKYTDSTVDVPETIRRENLTRKSDKNVTKVAKFNSTANVTEAIQHENQAQNSQEIVMQKVAKYACLDPIEHIGSGMPIDKQRVDKYAIVCSDDEIDEHSIKKPSSNVKTISSDNTDDQFFTCVDDDDYIPGTYESQTQKSKTREQIIYTESNQAKGKSMQKERITNEDVGLQGSVEELDEEVQRINDFTYSSIKHGSVSKDYKELNAELISNKSLDYFEVDGLEKMTMVEENCEKNMFLSNNKINRKLVLDESLDIFESVESEKQSRVEKISKNDNISLAEKELIMIDISDETVDIPEVVESADKATMEDIHKNDNFSSMEKKSRKQNQDEFLDKRETVQFGTKHSTENKIMESSKESQEIFSSDKMRNVLDKSILSISKTSVSGGIEKLQAENGSSAVNVQRCILLDTDQTLTSSKFSDKAISRQTDTEIVHTKSFKVTENASTIHPSKTRLDKVTTEYIDDHLLISDIKNTDASAMEIKNSKQGNKPEENILVNAAKVSNTYFDMSEIKQSSESSRMAGIGKYLSEHMSKDTNSIATKKNDHEKQKVEGAWNQKLSETHVTEISEDDIPLAQLRTMIKENEMKVLKPGEGESNEESTSKKCTKSVTVSRKNKLKKRDKKSYDISQHKSKDTDFISGKQEQKERVAPSQKRSGTNQMEIDEDDIPLAELLTITRNDEIKILPGKCNDDSSSKKLTHMRTVTKPTVSSEKKSKKTRANVEESEHKSENTVFILDELNDLEKQKEELASSQKLCETDHHEISEDDIPLAQLLTMTRKTKIKILKPGESNYVVSNGDFTSKKLTKTRKKREAKSKIANAKNKEREISDTDFILTKKNVDEQQTEGEGLNQTLYETDQSKISMTRNNEIQVIESSRELNYDQDPVSINSTETRTVTQRMVSSKRKAKKRDAIDEDSEDDKCNRIDGLVDGTECDVLQQQKEPVATQNSDISLFQSDRQRWPMEINIEEGLHPNLQPSEAILREPTSQDLTAMEEDFFKKSQIANELAQSQHHGISQTLALLGAAVETDLHRVSSQSEYPMNSSELCDVLENSQSNKMNKSPFDQLKKAQEEESQHNESLDQFDKIKSSVSKVISTFEQTGSLPKNKAGYKRYESGDSLDTSSEVEKSRRRRRRKAINIESETTDKTQILVTEHAIAKTLTSHDTKGLASIPVEIEPFEGLGMNADPINIPGEVCDESHNHLRDQKIICGQSEELVLIEEAKPIISIYSSDSNECSPHKPCPRIEVTASVHTESKIQDSGQGLPNNSTANQTTTQGHRKLFDLSKINDVPRPLQERLEQRLALGRESESFSEDIPIEPIKAETRTPSSKRENSRKQTEPNATSSKVTKPRKTRTKPKQKRAKGKPIRPIERHDLTCTGYFLSGRKPFSALSDSSESPQYQIVPTKKSRKRKSSRSEEDGEAPKATKTKRVRTKKAKKKEEVCFDSFVPQRDRGDPKSSSDDSIFQHKTPESEAIHMSDSSDFIPKSVKEIVTSFVEKRSGPNKEKPEASETPRIRGKKTNEEEEISFDRFVPQQDSHYRYADLVGRAGPNSSPEAGDSFDPFFEQKTPERKAIHYNTDPLSFTPKSFDFAETENRRNEPNKINILSNIVIPHQKEIEVSRPDLLLAEPKQGEIEVPRPDLLLSEIDEERFQNVAGDSSSTPRVIKVILDLSQAALNLNTMLPHEDIPVVRKIANICQNHLTHGNTEH